MFNIGKSKNTKQPPLLSDETAFLFLSIMDRKILE